VAGYYCLCPSGKSKTIRSISALFLLNYQSRSDANFSPARLAGSKSRYERDEAWSAGLNVCDCLRLLAVAKSRYKRDEVWSAANLSKILSQITLGYCNF